MKITSIRGQCFLSIGKTPIHIDFTKLGNIVNICGINHDRKSGSSNGSGKSTLLEIIVYSLYGKLLKNMTHKEALNNKIKKGLEVEVNFELKGVQYKVIRKRKPDSLQLWRNGDEVTRGGMPETQAELERILGLSYEAFVNIAFFGQHNRHSFLSCNPATKRQIVENLLSLEKYNRYCQIAKEKKKQLDNNIKNYIRDYEHVRNSVELCEKRLKQIEYQKAQWFSLRNNELQELKQTLAKKESELNNSTYAQELLLFQKSQQNLTLIQSKIEKIKDKIQQDGQKLNTLQESLQTKKIALHDVNLKINTLDNSIKSLHSNRNASKIALEPLGRLEAGVACPLCHGVVKRDYYSHIISHHESLINKIEEEINRLNSEKGILQEEKGVLTAEINELTSDVSKETVKIRENNELLRVCQSNVMKLEAVKEPVLGLQEKLVEKQREILEEQIRNKELEISQGDPYQSLLTETSNDLAVAEQRAGSIKESINQEEAKVPYYDFWIKGFGDKGIRSLVINDMIPALNTRINYWLQFLIDNQIKLTFNNDFEETIESNPSDGDPFVYNGLSGGEHNRIDLAISQAFAYLMMLSSGTCPSIVVLDEVVSYQDRPGVQCVYNMICELARDRQVLIITHDQDLLNLLEGQDTITVERKDGFSFIQ